MQWNDNALVRSKFHFMQWYKRVPVLVKSLSCCCNALVRTKIHFLQWQMRLLVLVKCLNNAFTQSKFYFKQRRFFLENRNINKFCGNKSSSEESVLIYFEFLIGSVVGHYDLHNFNSNVITVKKVVPQIVLLNY